MLDQCHDASPTRSGFAGFAEGSPLELPNTADVASGLLKRLRDGTSSAFAEAAAGVGYCAHPVRLEGTSTTFDTNGNVVATFASAEAPLGVLYRPCGNRRSDVCPACSRIYARDTFELIRAGVAGGKQVPAAVADNPLLFATFTAPSFGHVHGHRDGKRCMPRDKVQRCEHGKPLGCMQVHRKEDAAIGAPLCDHCYDWQSAVVWQWFASSELFRRTTQNIRRELAAAIGVTQAQLRHHASVQYAKVAEYQERGMVHFHVLIRLDGPEGPGSPAPSIPAVELAQVVIGAARRTTFSAPPVFRDDRARLLRWGQQLDVHAVRSEHRTDDPDSTLSAEQVAGYLAKYATKSVGGSHEMGRARPHLLRLEATAKHLGARAMLADKRSPYALLGRWAHMLGFPGHFSSKSRRYSTTLGRLRRARRRFQALTAEAKRKGEALDLAGLEERLLADDTETTLVVGSWIYQGSGWLNPGDEALAAAAAARAREYDQWRAQQRRGREERETRQGRDLRDGQGASHL